MLVALRICAVLFAISSSAYATSPQRTFVGSTGNDANPCSLTLPCRGFAAAVSAVADAGEVVVLDTAGYGSFSIAKSVSVIAPPGVYAGISVLSATDGVVINAPGSTVALRGLFINGQGGNRGIVVTDAGSVSIDNCSVSSLAGIGIQVDGNTSVKVSDSIVRDTGNTGVLANNGNVQLNRVQVRSTGVRGIEVTNGTMWVRDSVVTGTAQVGIIAQAPSGKNAKLTVERTTVTGTGFEGIAAFGGSGGTSTVVAVDNVVSDSPAFSAIVASGAGATMRASGNTSTRFGGWGLNNSGGGAVLETAGDNFVQGNTSGPTNGAITGVGKF